MSTKNTNIDRMTRSYIRIAESTGRKGGKTFPKHGHRAPSHSTAKKMTVRQLDRARPAPGPVRGVPSSGRWFIVLQIQAQKFVVVLEEKELHLPHGTIPMLSDNHFHDIFSFRLLVVVIIPVQKSDDIGILFNRSRFPEIRQHGTLVLTL